MHTCSIQSKTTQKNSKSTWKKKRSKKQSTPNQLSWKQKDSVAPVGPVSQHRCIQRQPVTPVPWLRFIRTVQQGSSDGKHSITSYTGVTWTSTGLFTMSSFKEHVLGVRNFASAPVTLVALLRSTGAFTIALIKGYVMCSDGNPSAPVTPVPHVSKHRCNIVRLSLCQMSTATIWI